jgi:hypothetical protein
VVFADELRDIGGAARVSQPTIPRITKKCMSNIPPTLPATDSTFPDVGTGESLLADRLDGTLTPATAPALPVLFIASPAAAFSDVLPSAGLAAPPFGKATFLICALTCTSCRSYIQAVCCRRKERGTSNLIACSSPGQTISPLSSSRLFLFSI